VSNDNRNNRQNNRSQNLEAQARAADQVSAAAVETIREDGGVLTAKELQVIIDDMKKGQATKNKILDWLLSAMGMSHIRPLLFHLSDICTQQEMAQCIDFIATKVSRDGDYIRSYKTQMLELIEIRERTAPVKQASLEELAAHG